MLLKLIKFSKDAEMMIKCFCYCMRYYKLSPPTQVSALKRYLSINIVRVVFVL